jgi:hypothetical protein
MKTAMMARMNKKRRRRGVGFRHSMVSGNSLIGFHQCFREEFQPEGIVPRMQKGKGHMSASPGNTSNHTWCCF